MSINYRWNTRDKRWEFQSLRDILVWRPSSLDVPPSEEEGKLFLRKFYAKQGRTPNFFPTVT